MVSNIRQLFTFTKKAHHQKSSPSTSRQSSLSPSSSIASLSTLSSGLQTPTNSVPSPQSLLTPPDIRGIFRTLDPYWSFYHPQQQDWIAFNLAHAELLEHHYQSRDSLLHLAPCPGLEDGCTLYFEPSRRQQQGPGLHLTMNHDLVRTVVPVWWYEQDLPDGTKGMCRFEPRNQVRLEALSEDRTQLSLTDAGFEGASMTVVTTHPQQHEEEEMRGLVYVYQASPMESWENKLDHLQMEVVDDEGISSHRRVSI